MDWPPLGIKWYFSDGTRAIAHADCRAILPLLSAIDSVITDPPYELGFMGKDWDSQGVSFQPETWQLVGNSCKPGAMMLSFGGTRTWHRLVCAIEDAGWQVRDTLMWLYGSGFPKSLDISKAIDKAAGSEREALGLKAVGQGNKRGTGFRHAGDIKGLPVTEPSTPAAKEWQGYGTALKPAWEPICLAMKPLDGTFAHNALTHGVAGLNVDGGRIGYEENCRLLKEGTYGGDRVSGVGSAIFGSGDKAVQYGISSQGRFPANLILDEEAARMLDEQSGILTSGNNPAVRHADKHRNVYAGWKGEQCLVHRGTDSGGASRFFYCAKASRKERDEGIDDALHPLIWSSGTQTPGSFQSPGTLHAARNNHPTVKPLSLMEYLCKLTMTPTGGIVLDPFMGSGTTGVACQRVGRKFIGIDDSEQNCEIAAKRMAQSIMPLTY